MAPDLDRAWILGGFCLLAMAACASLMVLSEPITFNIQMLITGGGGAVLMSVGSVL